MKCPNCQTDLPDDARFCLECGARLGAPPPAQQAQAQDRSAAATGRGAAIVGDENIGITGDVGHDLTLYVTKNYLSGSPELDEKNFRDALTRYLTWLD
jgi:hypothetical protein